jgi:hypothetical protein
VRQWQVVQSHDGLRVLLVAPGTELRTIDVRHAIEESLRHAGAMTPPLTVELVTEVTRTALGKAPLVRARL